MKPSLTILTNTVPPEKQSFLKIARLLKRLMLGKRPLFDQYEGHPQVTRSVLMGLKNIGAFFNYNPNHISEIAPTVLVLSNLNALRQAIDLKKRGAIQTLFGGPILVIDPSDEKELMSSSAIDGIIVSSDWVHNFYIQEIPELLGKCKIWPTGVNIDEWVPVQITKTPKNVLIYDKLNHGQCIEDYQKFLAARGWNTSILRYGYYKKKQFLKMLRESQLAIFFSQSESQGIALAESWAADVPTLVWNQGWAYLKKNHKKIPASSAPYLNRNLGIFFPDLSSFKETFGVWEKERSSFRPRQWVCSYFSDEVCAQKLLQIVGILP